MKIFIFGAGVQGTLYGLRLAKIGHDVILIARGTRAQELSLQGAVIQGALTGRMETLHLSISEALDPGSQADLCFVFVRREQIELTLPVSQSSPAIGRFVFMVNHANGSQFLFEALG